MKNKKLFAILTLLCFMMTLMPVAAFAAVDAGESYVFTEDANASEEVNENVTVQFDFNNDSTTKVFVWFVKDGANVASKQVTRSYTNDDEVVTVEANQYGVFEFDATEGADYNFQFASAGNYTVKAALEAPKYTSFDTLAAAFANAENVLMGLNDHKKIEITSSTSSKNYGVNIDGAKYVSGDKHKVNGTEKDGYYADGVQYQVTGVKADNVVGNKITVAFVDENGVAVKGEKVSFSTNSSNIELNKEEATTNQLGKVDFKIAGAAEGTYKIYVTLGSFEAVIDVVVGSTGAAYINIVREPSAPVDVDTEDLKDYVRFSFSDINGNSVKLVDMNDEPAFEAKSNHVSIVSKPSASDLEDSDVSLIARQKAGKAHEYEATLKIKGGLDAEGTYEFKVVLKNGNYKIVTVEVKEFQTPVKLNLVYAAPSVELGGQIDIDKIEYVDANGVVKSLRNGTNVTKVDLAASGYGVEYFNTTTGTVIAKTDEKYVGSEITVTAVDTRYNLVATASLTVADDAKELKFATKTAEVNVNNKISGYVADSQGNRVVPGANAKAATISFVVLDKPEGAKVSATLADDSDFLTGGSFKMALTSNKIGNVTVQAIAKVTVTKTDDENNTTTNTNNQVEVVKYYTGTQIFAVGNGSVGDVVVMSIGSNEIIVNDAKATIDAAPMVQNDRTYVPFRALAEAFGAEVAYDEATQAVTAELNGVTVVMTIGSATYTVNGEEKTMDVAPFINGSRTMVPVRFAAEAFGIKVIPTYDENGATADILFNL